MVFGIQNSDFRTRIAGLYGSQPSSAVFAFKTATLPPELLVSMASSVVFACKTATFGSELQVSMGPRLRLRFFTFKTATLVPEL